jgi:hypothetical protein
MCLNETCSKFRISRLLSDKFPIQNGLKKEIFCRHCFSILFQKVPLGKSKNLKSVCN